MKKKKFISKWIDENEKLIRFWHNKYVRNTGYEYSYTINSIFIYGAEILTKSPQLRTNVRVFKEKLINSLRKEFYWIDRSINFVSLDETAHYMKQYEGFDIDEHKEDGEDEDMRGILTQFAPYLSLIEVNAIQQKLAPDYDYKNNAKIERAYYRGITKIKSILEKNGINFDDLHEKLPVIIKNYKCAETDGLSQQGANK